MQESAQDVLGLFGGTGVVPAQVGEELAVGVVGGRVVGPAHHEGGLADPGRADHDRQCGLLRVGLPHPVEPVPLLLAADEPASGAGELARRQRERRACGRSRSRPRDGHRGGRHGRFLSRSRRCSRSRSRSRRRQRSGRGRARGRCGRFRPQHLLEGLAQARARLDAEFQHQPFARPVVALQRLGLPPVLLEAEHQHPDQRLPQAVGPHGLVERGDRLPAPAEGEFDLGPGFEHAQVLLVEAAGGGLAAFPGGQVGERAAAPQREGVAQQAGLDPGVVGVGGPAHQFLEAVQVHLVGRAGEPVSVVLGQQFQPAAQQFAQRGDMALERLPGPWRRGALPGEPHQPPDRHGPVELQGQPGQHGAPFGTADGQHRAPFGTQLDRPQQQDPHVTLPCSSQCRRTPGVRPTIATRDRRSRSSGRIPGEPQYGSDGQRPRRAAAQTGGGSDGRQLVQRRAGEGAVGDVDDTDPALHRRAPGQHPGEAVRHREDTPDDQPGLQPTVLVREQLGDRPDPALQHVGAAERSRHLLVPPLGGDRLVPDRARCRGRRARRSA